MPHMEVLPVSETHRDPAPWETAMSDQHHTQFTLQCNLCELRRGREREREHERETVSERKKCRGRVKTKTHNNNKTSQSPKL